MITLDLLAAVIVLGIACWRLARILPTDTVAEPIRGRIAEWTYPEVQLPANIAQRRQWIGSLLSCQICLAFHIAWMITVFWSLVILGEWIGWMFLIVWPSVAGVAAIAALYDQGDPE